MTKIPGEILRVLLAIRSMEHGGGAESLVFNIYRELKKRTGVKVKLVAFQKSGEYNNTGFFEVQLAGDPDFHYCNSNISLSLLGKNRIDVSDFVQIVNGFKPHIIHSHLFMAELISREKLFPAAKYFTHTHDNMKQLMNFSFRTPFTKELLTNFYEKEHLIAKYKEADNNFIAISEDTKNYFREVVPGELKNHIFYLENAINTRQFNLVNHPRDLKKLRIVNVGGFLPKKNQKFLVEVCEELLQRGWELEARLLGDGPQHEQVRALIDKKGLKNQIFTTGNVVNVEEHYRWANIYVHSAYYEPFGLVLIEAMACGLPVVSLDGKGNRILVNNGVNGYLITAQDKILFANAIENIMKDENLYRSLAENALKFAAQYDIEAYVDKLIAIYENADSQPASMEIKPL